MQLANSYSNVILEHDKLELTMEVVGRLIKKGRQEMGLTQAELAGITGLSRGRISGMELREKTLVDDRTLSRLVEALKVPAPVLIYNQSPTGSPTTAHNMVSIDDPETRRFFSKDWDFLN